VEWLIPDRIHNTDSVSTGDYVEFNISPNAKEVNVITPTNDNFKIMPPNPAKLFSNTDEIGIYKLKQEYDSGSYEHIFAVNSPAEYESNLKKTTYIVDEENIDSLKKDSINYGYSLKQIILLFIIVILLIEWWLYLSGI
jgi:hypothetical protein